MTVNFLNVINNIINPNLAKGKWNSGSGTYAGNVCCPDCYFGFINGGVVTKNVISGFTTKPNNNVIVVLAESPHIDEFNYLPTVSANFPLMKEHNKIFNKIVSKANSTGKYVSTNNYDIYLVNAIQYQCSLGNRPLHTSNNQKIRNEVFSYTWNMENGLQDLIDRINLIIGRGYNINNSIILNCCTSLLKNCCDSNSIRAATNIDTFDEKHPSIW